MSRGTNSMAVTDKNFGIVIAFLIPGWLLLWGLSFSNREVAVWLSQPNASLTVAGFLFASLASMGLGLLVSAIRWLVIDHVLVHLAGLTIPKLDFSKLSDPNRFAAFQGVVENHYRYYQYYSNTLISVLIGFSIFLSNAAARPTIEECVLVALAIVALMLASRDCFRKYYERSADILS